MCMVELKSGHVGRNILLGMAGMVYNRIVIDPVTRISELLNGKEQLNLRGEEWFQSK